MITLYKNKKDCCGCGACMNVCPKNAITMKSDGCGFAYPFIDIDTCVECGACLKACGYQRGNSGNEPSDVYVAASKNDELILSSASGGVFSTIARKIVEEGGIVYGAAMMKEDDRFVVRHIGVENRNDLVLLAGSKYVQSETRYVFSEIKSHLQEGREVLFSGTPCQCAGLRAYLKKDYKNLFVIDIICHGVPNIDMFNDYIKANFSNYSDVRHFRFRDKTKGWDMTARLDYSGGSVLIPGRTSSYFTLFLDGHIYRENCYSCIYACPKRVGDITIGDYWGIQKQHPELLKDGRYSPRKGISCILVNTENGQRLVDKARNDLYLDKSEFIKVSARNEQLVKPSKESVFREEILDLYSHHGYKAVEQFYKAKYKKQIVIHRIFNMMPYFFKEFVRRVLH